jgi:predicted transporter
VVSFFFDEGVLDLEFIFGVDTGKTVDFSDMSFRGNTLVFGAEIRFDFGAFRGRLDY